VLLASETTQRADDLQKNLSYDPTQITRKWFFKKFSFQRVFSLCPSCGEILRVDKLMGETFFGDSGQTDWGVRRIFHARNGSFSPEGIFALYLSLSLSLSR
jgi:hypothetical protein